ncbi:homoserine O-acetyltransferase [Cokeromyces recurvatus]|uniref:homoserine O-acetyltransferase n=1 Tax=Cokeromyces recurvatus TaxID=90255 RepID=UPI00221F580D|nr:homoserine O-acetyltransferase [Cokeromyces recurvatus]KAI7897954.1 homoserine O-acetyltransferase [Cokeromyces recurvatus]
MQEYRTYVTLNECPPELSKNKLIKLVPNQNITVIPEFTLESGVKLTNIPIAWKSWGKLNEKGDNCMIICHALTGSADVEDWWGPLMGPKRAFDPTKFFIICCNVLGSPYGSASPLTINPETGKIYGPEFPLVSIRDDVHLHRLVLDSLGVRQVAICIGGSMGGMQVLEWAKMDEDYVRTIVPIATSGRHSAWGISWGEAQRQSIYSDPNYVEGYYTEENPPVVGLSAARMSALLTYRSRNSFESRFGRKAANWKPKSRPSSPAEANRLIHNDGHRSIHLSETQDETSNLSADPSSMPTPFIFSAQSYLRYQGNKFINRFDANCYIALTRKMDSHDISRGRTEDYYDVLASIGQPALVIGIESDGLFTISEQYELAEGMADTEMIVIQSPDGHDGFLLEFDQINRHILNFIKRVLPDIYNTSTLSEEEVVEQSEVLQATKTSLFGEAEVDITQW